MASIKWHQWQVASSKQQVASTKQQIASRKYKVVNSNLIDHSDQLDKVEFINLMRSSIQQVDKVIEVDLIDYQDQLDQGQVYQFDEIKFIFMIRSRRSMQQEEYSK